jgi:hypothetical protein
MTVSNDIRVCLILLVSLVLPTDVVRIQSTNLQTFLSAIGRFKRVCVRMPSQIFPVSPTSFFSIKCDAMFVSVLVMKVALCIISANRMDG